MARRAAGPAAERGGNMDEHALRRWEAEKFRGHCRLFSRIGWALFAQMFLGLAVQLVVLLPVRAFAPALLGNLSFVWVLSVACTYGIGCGAFCLVMRGLPSGGGGARQPLRPVRFLQVFCVAAAALYLSNYVTLMITGLIGALKGSPVTNPVEGLMEFPMALNLLLSCVIAPVLEELMFRKILLDRLRPYGECFAIFASALCFGLFHGNLSQLLYAFATGAVFAWVALKTNCVWQTMLLHAMINFIAAGLIPLLGLLGEDGTTLLGLFVLGLLILGVVFFLSYRRDLSLDRGHLDLREQKKWRLFFENPGMAVFCLLVLCSSVMSLF